jgi:hypothetical protein
VDHTTIMTLRNVAKGRRDCGAAGVASGPAPSRPGRAVRTGPPPSRQPAADRHHRRASRRAGGSAGKRRAGLERPDPNSCGRGRQDCHAGPRRRRGRRGLAAVEDLRAPRVGPGPGVWRWQTREAAGALDDARPGGNRSRPVGLGRGRDAGLVRGIGPVDLPHRKPAHRGSYLDRVFVSPSSVDRVLARHGLALAGLPGRRVRCAGRGRTGWNGSRTSCGAGTPPTSCVAPSHRSCTASSMSCPASGSPRSSPRGDIHPGEALFLAGLDAEGLLESLEWCLDRPGDVDLAEEAAPILLAVSDNGAEMRSDETRAFMALVTIGQHFGRPSTPTDQALDRDPMGPRQSREPPISSPSPTPPSSPPSWTEPGSTTTTPACMRPSATSPPTTNTKAAATRCAEPAATASTPPTPPAVSTTAATETSTCHDQPQPPARQSFPWSEFDSTCRVSQKRLTSTTAQALTTNRSVDPGSGVMETDARSPGSGSARRSWTTS